MTKQLPNHIKDGYTENGYIAEVPGLHGSLRFKFRPMRSVERSIISNEIVRKSVPDAHATIVTATKARVREWDSVDGNGNPVGITAESIAALRPSLFDRLFEIVSGRGPSDIDPTATAAEQDQSADLALQAAIEGRTVGALREESDEKNLSGV